MQPTHVSTTPTRRRRGSVAGVIATMISVATPPFLVGTISLQIAATIAFSPAQVGLAVAGYYAFSAAFSPFGGRLVHRWGATRSMRLACLGATAGLAAVALAPDGTTIVIALSLLGVPNALVQPAANQILSDTVPARRQGVAFGLVQSAIPTATLLSGALLAVFNAGERWRIAVGLVAALTLAAQLLIRTPDGERRTPARRTPAQSAAQPAAATQPAPALPRPIGGAPLMLALVLGAVLASMAATSLPSFVASTGDARGLTAGQVAAVQVTGSLACIVLRVLSAWRGSLLHGWRVLGGVAGMLAVGSVGFALIAAGSPVLFAVGVVVAYAFGWGWNALFNLSVSRARVGRVSASTGLTQGGVFLGGVLGPLLFAAVLEQRGDASAWLVVAAAGFAASVSIVLAARRWAGAERPAVVADVADKELTHDG